jgi:hypothetical protein
MRLEDPYKVKRTPVIQLRLRACSYLQQRSVWLWTIATITHSLFGSMGKR